MPSSPLQTLCVSVSPNKLFRKLLWVRCFITKTQSLCSSAIVLLHASYWQDSSVPAAQFKGRLLDLGFRIQLLNSDLRCTFQFWDQIQTDRLRGQGFYSCTVSLGLVHVSEKING